MPTTVENISNLTNSVGETIIQTGDNIFTTLSETLNAAGDYVLFGSNDRRHGQMGLILGPIYDAMWQSLSAIISSMLGLHIGNYCNFNDRMYGYMTRLMLINLWEHNTTLSMLCEGSSNQANGNSQTITHEAQIPPYTLGNNYLQTARNLIKDEIAGRNSTSIDISDGPYIKTKNLFPDDNDQRSGNFSNGDAWETTDRNSILYKTKCLFRQRKINSLISRYGTNADPNPNPTHVPEEGNARTVYGLSHGRNLLKKSAEGKMADQESYRQNGYNNPYCRVWTHHAQYKKFKDTMRGFNVDGDISNVNFWGEKFADMSLKDLEKFNWRGGSARWEKTVLDGRGDGLINITPHFSGGGAKNIHSKDCMFSIENLAWKDYDPYSFETALSWEQRGPLGGRIMWFPPYGLTFNETSSAQWSSNTFIGRGEDVYTYVNTKRTGTLQFYLVVDHPSILDYVSWYEANRDLVKDTDILRYFAGCDPVDPNNSDSLLYYAQPTPLTDEGIEGTKGGKPEKVKKIKPKEDIPADVETIQFIVYFPNNYSGWFDVNDPKLGPGFLAEYLLAGTNAQEKCAINGNTPENEPMPFSDASQMTGPGYEMEMGTGISIIDDEKDAQGKVTKYLGIVGNSYAWSKNNTKAYSPDTKKVWRYRIDGTYEVPTTDNTGELNNIYSNNYAQTLPNNSSYKDSKNYHLNCSLDKQDVNYKTIPETAYTFAEVVQAVAEVSDNTKLIEFFKSRPNINGGDDHKKRIEKLKTVFGDAIKEDTKLKLDSIRFQGFSNTQGVNSNASVNKSRNNILANSRAKAIAEWFKTLLPKFSDIPLDISSAPPEDVGTTDEDALKAKAYRATKCTLLFSRDATVDATDAEEKGDKYVGFYEAKGETFGGRQLYKIPGDDKSRWVEITDESGDVKLVKIEYNPKVADYADEDFWLKVMEGKAGTDKEIQAKQEWKDTVFNKIRYDQEYHFFRRVQEETPMIYEKLMDKIKYFDPAFHSMTPEGFNARCTFLNQCTRQGNTVGVSDKNRLSASNMAFGRPPFCVLRLGDFYNQMIIIDSVNIQYDTSGGVVWDLNDEGVGVQPMLAQVSLNFTFIGGGSLDGPIRRLQNAMSFNYYSNSELYDNRADQAVYNYDRGLSMGGAGKGNMDIDQSNFRSVGMYDPNHIY